MPPSVLLTGHTGHVVSRLYSDLGSDFKVFGLGSGRQGPCPVDIRDRDQVFRFMSDHAPFQAVVHGAALTKGYADSHRSSAYDQINVIGTQNVLDASIESGCQTFIYLSSISVYGGTPYNTPDIILSQLQPVGCYGKSKLAAEKYCDANKHKLKIYRLRLSPVYTESDVEALRKRVYVPGLSRKLACSIQSNTPRFTFCHDRTLRDAVRTCLDGSCSPGVYNVSDSKVFTQRELMDITFSVDGHKRVTVLPDALARFIPSMISTLDFVVGPQVSLLSRKMFGENVYPVSKELI